MEETVKKRMFIIVVIVLIIGTLLSTTTTIYAMGGKTTYNVSFKTAGFFAQTINEILITVHGTKGSTAVHNVGEVGKSSARYTLKFTDVNVGRIQSVTVQNLYSYNTKEPDDNWFPEYIVVNGTIIYGGRWVENEKAMVFSLTDNVYKIIVETCGETSSGTDSDVYIQLKAKNGKLTEELNATHVHGASNPFEKNDIAIIYLYAPDGFDSVESIKFSLPDTGMHLVGKPWKLKEFTITKIQGENYNYETAERHEYIFNDWIAKTDGSSHTKTFVVA